MACFRPRIRWWPSPQLTDCRQWWLIRLRKVTWWIAAVEAAACFIVPSTAPESCRDGISGRPRLCLYSGRAKTLPVPWKQNFLLSPEFRTLLQSVDTRTIATAIETLDLRMRNNGYIHFPIMGLMPSHPPIAGYAVTGRIRRWIRSGAPPISNLCYHQRAEFSGGTRPSHGYGHIVDFGEPVEIGGLKMAPGDILRGDLHGVQSIARGVRTKLADTVGKIREHEDELIRLCNSGNFSMQKPTAMLGKDSSCPSRNRR